MPDETALVERLVERDGAALTTVYAAHAEQVYRTALRVTANDELARDSAQEVFIFLWDIPNGSTSPSPRSWCSFVCSPDGGPSTRSLTEPSSDPRSSPT